jgi:hypothetical protein
MSGSVAYDQEEEKTDPGNAVLVEADKIEDLRAAYPNYFLDVALFTTGLKSVLRGGDVPMPSDMPEQTWKADDLSWIRFWAESRHKRGW